MNIKEEIKRLETVYKCSIKTYKLGTKYGATAIFSATLKRVGTTWLDSEDEAITQIEKIVAAGPYPTMT